MRRFFNRGIVALSILSLVLQLCQAIQVALVPDHVETAFVHPPLRQSVLANPPLLTPGSIYQSKLIVPILGPQVFLLRIVDAKTARIVIAGHLQLDDSVQYMVDEATGQISFVLTENTKRVLRRFGTRLGRVNYNAEQDQASLEVHPPLPFSLTLQFQRIHAHGGESGA